MKSHHLLILNVSILVSLLAACPDRLGAADPPGPAAPAVITPPTLPGTQLWKDPSQPTAARVQDLVRRLTLPEKVSQLSCDTAAIPRLGIPAYSHRNECLHGVVGTNVTVFPQAIGMAATWDAPLIHQEADAIAAEARGRHNDYAAKHHGNSILRFGLSFYTPNINIFRDPRWGRGQETYGEDPFLTAQIAVAFIKGLQGNNPKYVKIMACAKHFAVHNGPESKRHFFDANPSPRDLYETYLPAFEAAVRQGHVGSVMGAYSALYGKPACASPFLLTDLLRDQWGFDGVVVSDGGAIYDIWAKHHFVPTPEAAAAAAVRAGCDFCSGNCGATPTQLRSPTNWASVARGWWSGGQDYNVLPLALHKGLITEKEIDAALTRELTARFRLGLFDPPAIVPFSSLSLAQVDTPEHRALALKVARKSIVLLKNDGLLPLNPSTLKRIAVIGANADSQDALLGNYNGTPSHSVTILDGIKALAGPAIQVLYQKGCPLAARSDGSNKPTPESLAQTIAMAKSADLVIYVGGLDSTLEKEEAGGAKDTYEGFSHGDRTAIELPAVQTVLLKALQATGKPVVFINCSGSAIAMPWEAQHLNAILQAWYPGEEGGTAVAQVLFGDANPAGRLPVTFYRSTSDLPPFDNYSMSNRTYRYFSGKPLFAFGHGLSYTTFQYSQPKLQATACQPTGTLKLAFTLKNTGHLSGDEVPQVYFRHLDSPVPQPRPALCAFTRIHLAPGQSANITMNIPAERFRYWDTARKQYVVAPENYELLIGAASDDIRLRLPLAITPP